MLTRVRVPFFMLIALALIALVFSGCGFSSPASQAPSNGSSNIGAPSNLSSKQPVQPTLPITVYNVDKDANYLVAEVHKVEVSKIGKKPAALAMELLLAGTKNPNLVSALPAGVKLKKLTIENGIAYADFDKSLLKRGGSMEEKFVVGAIVNTLTEFPQIEKVQILVEGKKIATVFGHLDVSQPLNRSEQIIKK